jgi:hypothetical protein
LSGTTGSCTVTEGVETVEQFCALHALGADLIQGYLVARPMPAERLLNAVLVGEVVLERERPDGVLASIDTDHRGPFARQPIGDDPGEGAGGPGDHAHLVGQPRRATRHQWPSLPNQAAKLSSE